MRHRLGLATRAQISVCKSPFPSAGSPHLKHGITDNGVYSDIHDMGTIPYHTIRAVVV